MAPRLPSDRIIEAVNMDELDDLDDEPGVPVAKGEPSEEKSQVEIATEKARKIEEESATPTDGEEKSALTATPLGELTAEDLEDEPRAPLLVAATPYVVLIS